MSTHPYADALKGIRVLSMEQAAALPFATRHLADLGAEVIRVQSHRRSGGVPLDGNYQRNKLMLGLDLARPEGPALFRRLAAECDVVAHNFTPRVMQKYAIDWQSIAASNPRVIYCSLTGFGATGPWSDRPLFGPGAEAVSGQNMMIGEGRGISPGRPGTITYADNVCGLNLLFAILAALDHRDETGEGQHIDISLYETGVCQIGAMIGEYCHGSPLPEACGNRDLNYLVHDVFATRGHDRHVVITADEAQREALLAVLALDNVGELRQKLSLLDGDDVVSRLQQAGVAAAVVADAADVATSSQLRARQYFGVMSDDIQALPVTGPAWGGGNSVNMSSAHRTGEDNNQVLRDVLHLSASDIETLTADNVVGEVLNPQGPPGAVRHELRIERGELSRVDEDMPDWNQLRDSDS
jgi:crotonobetainyl-CoA:carnitine CoA-transferase CaiB-like acyl-CoA transferase